ncbi:MAG TPA: DUF6152 family protein [Caulobacteraceae bacterium]|jgi:hypothetical protein|nr:DUF6152 family protein [Caulobacteraceae bacterium]
MERANITRGWRPALACLGALGLAATLSAPASAHHSFAMFDTAKTVTIQGTVSDLELVNPHSWLKVMAPGKTGKPVVWSIEMGALRQVENMGLKADTAKPGDKITVSIHPLRNGAVGGSFISAVLADGKEVAQRGRLQDTLGGKD